MISLPYLQSTIYLFTNADNCFLSFKSLKDTADFISFPNGLVRRHVPCIDFVGKFLPQMQCWQMHDGNNIKFTEQLFYSITTNVPVN